jgi:hypothetical protein
MIRVETYFSSHFRKTGLIPSESYQPNFYNLDPSSLHLFSTQEASGEAWDQRQQLLRIFEILKSRFLIFKSVAREKEGNDDLESFTNRLKQMQGQSRPAYTVKGIEVLCRKDAEEKRLKNRRVDAKSVLAYLKEWKKNVRIDVRKLLLERLTGFADLNRIRSV